MREGVRVTSFMDAHGPVQPDSFRDMAAAAAAAGTPLPPLLADSTRTTPFRPTVTDTARTALAAYSKVARGHGERWREVNSELGFDEGDQVKTSFEYHPGDEIDDVDDQFAIRFLHAFWRLCGQQLAQLDVRLVTLHPGRRGTDSPPEAAGWDWQHRWIVRMHKVCQWYPSEQRHKILYRGPYVKGPADKPLLGGDVVRALT